MKLWKNAACNQRLRRVFSMKSMVGGTGGAVADTMVLPKTERQRKGIREMNIKIANRLVELRKAHGYSQEMLAAELGLSRQAISKWERGESSPDLDNILELSKVYGITLDALIKGEEETVETERDAAAIYDDAKKKYLAAKEAYEQAETDFFRSGFAQQEEILQEGDPADGGREAAEDGRIRFSASLYIDDEHGEKGAWSSFLYAPAAAIVYLLLGFLLGWWLEGTVLFLTIPVYYSIAGWLDGGRQGSLMKAIPYPIVAAIVYLLLGFLFGIWHPGWIIFLTVPIYDALAKLPARRSGKQSGR